MTGSHVKIGFLALCLALLLALPAAWLSSNDAAPGIETNIAIEHGTPVTLHVLRLSSSGTNVFEIKHSASGSVAIHVPDSWKRQEVRGVPLASVTSEPQEWGYVRWMLPRGAIVRFDAPNPGTVMLHNPSGIPVTVSTVRVNVERQERQEDAMIVTTGPYVLP